MTLLPGKTASQEIARLKAQNYALIIGAQQSLARAQECVLQGLKQLSVAEPLLRSGAAASVCRCRVAKANRLEEDDSANEWRFEINGAKHYQHAVCVSTYM